MRYALNRARKYGPLKVVSEAMLFRHLRYNVLPQQHELMKKEMFGPIWEEFGGQLPDYMGNQIRSSNVNEKAVREFLEECKPDVIFAMCLNDFFGKRIRSIPKHGVFLWHEGLLPEYRGLYAPFWTLYNQDYNRLGFSLIRMNEVIDGGELLSYGFAQDIDLRKHGYVYIGHKAILDSLPEVSRVLSELQDNRLKPIHRKDAKSNYYTYPGYFDYMRMKKRLIHHLGEKPSW